MVTIGSRNFGGWQFGGRHFDVIAIWHHFVVIDRFGWYWLAPARSQLALSVAGSPTNLKMSKLSSKRI
jgi:hypothetical protein